jgi:hypothetical protein
MQDYGGVGVGNVVGELQRRVKIGATILKGNRRSLGYAALRSG